MPGQHEYEYAVIRIVPRVDREEFVNAGVILYCKAQRFLGFRYALDEALMVHFAPSLDLAEVRENLEAFDRICCSGTGSGDIGALDIGERFRWLTATRSTVLQLSQVHPGYTADAAETLDKLFGQLVTRST